MMNLFGYTSRDPRNIVPWPGTLFSYYRIILLMIEILHYLLNCGNYVIFLTMGL